LVELIGIEPSVYLTDMALELIGARDGYIFPSPKKVSRQASLHCADDKPISQNSMAMSLRRNILGASDGKRRKGLAGRKKHQAKRRQELPPRPANRIGVEFFRPHDLRRTVLTGLAKLKVSYEVRERVVNSTFAGRKNL